MQRITPEDGRCDGDLPPRNKKVNRPHSRVGHLRITGTPSERWPVRTSGAGVGVDHHLRACLPCQARLSTGQSPRTTIGGLRTQLGDLRYRSLCVLSSGVFGPDPGASTSPVDRAGEPGGCCGHLVAPRARIAQCRPGGGTVIGQLPERPTGVMPVAEALSDHRREEAF